MTFCPLIDIYLRFSKSEGLMLSNMLREKLAEGKNIMGRREDLKWGIELCDAQLGDFGSFKEILGDAGLDLDTPYTNPADKFDDPLARRIFGEAQDRFMESRENLYGKVGEIAAKRARLQAELDELESRSR